MITRMLPSVGARFCISASPPLALLALGVRRLRRGAPPPNGCSASPPNRPCRRCARAARAPRRRLSLGWIARRLWHSAAVGGLSRPTSRFTLGLTFGRLSSSGRTSQLKYTRLRPIGPCASAVLTTLLRSWLAQCEEEQEAVLAFARVVGELVEEFVEHLEADRELRQRFGEAFGRGPSSLTTGRISRANGRISFLMIGVVAWRACWSLRCAGASALANGSSSCSVGPSTSVAVRELAEAGCPSFPAPRAAGAASSAGSLPPWRRSGTPRWRRPRAGRAACPCRRALPSAAGSCGSSGRCSRGGFRAAGRSPGRSARSGRSA